MARASGVQDSSSNGRKEASERGCATNATRCLAGSTAIRRSGFSCTMAARALALTTVTAALNPALSAIAPCMPSASLAPLGLAQSNSTLPLFSSVRTFWWPRPTKISRNSAMAMRFARPTLMPRISATHSVMRAPCKLLGVQKQLCAAKQGNGLARVLAGNDRIPNLGCSTEMRRFRDRDNRSFQSGTQMVGLQFDGCKAGGAVRQRRQAAIPGAGIGNRDYRTRVEVAIGCQVRLSDRE